MKIARLTDNDVTLKESRASNIAIGIIIILIGIIVLKQNEMEPSIFWAAIAFIAFGLIWIVSWPVIIIRADRTSQQISFHRKWFLWRQNAFYAMEDVVRIETSKQWRFSTFPRQEWGPKPVLVYKSFIVFKSGHRLPLDYRNNSASMSSQSGCLPGGKTIARYMASFLHVPLQEID